MYLQPFPIACITAWALSPVRSVAVLDSHRRANPAVNCTCEGPRLRAPYENLKPEGLRWSWDNHASAGDQLQTPVIISTKNTMCLNQPQTIPPTPIYGRIVFRETSPWCQKRLESTALDYTELTWVIQENVIISRFLITVAKSFVSWKKTHSQVLGMGMWTLLRTRYWVYHRHSPNIRE